jgi:hypothetical protein
MRAPVLAPEPVLFYRAGVWHKLADLLYVTAERT